MAANLYVPDANVFLEHIYARPLQETSKKLIRDAVLERIQLAVPCLLLDEITEVLCGNMESLPAAAPCAPSAASLAQSLPSAR